MCTGVPHNLYNHIWESYSWLVESVLESSWAYGAEIKKRKIETLLLRFLTMVSHATLPKKSGSRWDRCKKHQPYSPTVWQSPLVHRCGISTNLHSNPKGKEKKGLMSLGLNDDTILVSMQSTVTRPVSLMKVLPEQKKAAKDHQTRTITEKSGCLAQLRCFTDPCQLMGRDNVVPTQLGLKTRCHHLSQSPVIHFNDFPVIFTSSMRGIQDVCSARWCKSSRTSTIIDPTPIGKGQRELDRITFESGKFLIWHQVCLWSVTVTTPHQVQLRKGWEEPMHQETIAGSLLQGWCKERLRRIDPSHHPL